MPIRLLRNLLFTTEAIGDHDSCKPGLAHLGEQHTLTARNGYVIFVGFVAERAGHAAATGLQDLIFDRRPVHQRSFFLEPHYSLVMTMSLYDRLPLNLGRFVAIHFAFKKF